MKVKSLVCLALAVAAGAVGPAHAEKSTDHRTLKIVTPTAPGSAVDLLARAYSRTMSEVDGFNSYIDNRTGAEGILGVSNVISSPADGNTLLFTSSSMVVLNSIIFPKITTYDPLKDLVPVATVSKATLIMSLGSNVNFKSAREFISAARQNPGKYSCATSSTTTRMGCEYFQVATNSKLLIVPYKATGAAVLGLGSGEADMMIADAASFQAQWDTGRVRPVVVLGEQRLPALPNVPTAKEEGVPDFLMSAWYGAFFKAGTPPEKVAAMQKRIQQASESPAVKQALKTFSHEPYVLTGDAMAAMHRSEMDQWKKMVETHGIKFTDN